MNEFYGLCYIPHKKNDVLVFIFYVSYTASRPVTSFQLCDGHFEHGVHGGLCSRNDPQTGCLQTKGTSFFCLAIMQ